MAISFIRVDDRIIHGQITTSWMREYACDGIVAVNDHVAGDENLKAIYKSVCGKKTFVWGIDEWRSKRDKVLESDSNYFLITKTVADMNTILVEDDFAPGIREIVVGPMPMRQDSRPVGKNHEFYLTDDEARAAESLYKAGYSILFAMIKESIAGQWKDFRSSFGFGG